MTKTIFNFHPQSLMFELDFTKCSMDSMAH